MAQKLSPLIMDFQKDTGSYFSPISSGTVTPSILRPTTGFTNFNIDSNILNQENKSMEIINGDDRIINGQGKDNTDLNGKVTFGGEKVGFFGITAGEEGDDGIETEKERLADREASRAKSRSPSPHCHFAPLPKVDAATVVLSRRNSVALGVVNRGKLMGSNDGIDEPLAIELESTHSDFSSISALSNTLAGSQIHSPRPTTPRSFSNPRSPSHSPSISRPTSAQGNPILPPLSRKSSIDHISHHYIEANKSRSSSISRTSSQQGQSRTVSKERISEKEKEIFGFDLLRSREAASWREERNGPFVGLKHATVVVGNPTNLAPAIPTPSLEARSLASLSTASYITSPTLSSTGGGGGLISPSLGTRKTFFVDPLLTEKEKESISNRCRPVELIRKRSNEEVIEISPETNEEIIDEEEEEEEDEDEDEEDEEEDTLEGERENDQEEEEEEEEELEIISAQARGAAVERVHWHRDEPEVVVEQ